MFVEGQENGFGYVRQESQGDTLIIRVKLNIEDCFEDVAPMDNRGCYHAVMTATRRVLGFPEDNWQYVRGEVVFPEIDLFAPLVEEINCNGAMVVLRDPENQERTGIFKTDLFHRGSELLWIAHACAKVFTEYYGAKGIEAKKRSIVPL